MMVGNILKKQTYIPTVIIKHEHPDWGYNKHDEIHLLNHQNLDYDRKLFESRRKINFGL